MPVSAPGVQERCPCGRTGVQLPGALVVSFAFRTGARAAYLGKERVCRWGAPFNMCVTRRGPLTRRASLLRGCWGAPLLRCWLVAPCPLRRCLCCRQFVQAEDGSPTGGVELVARAVDAGLQVGRDDDDVIIKTTMP